MSPEVPLSLEAAIRRFLDSLAFHSSVGPARILVAISGGSDSTGLLLALAEAIKATSSSDISLCAATVDHALRVQSADEARQVATFCAVHGIPHVTCVWQGDKPSTGIMAAAREARYGLLADAAKRLGANVIVTGHTLDDQQETLRMREARSSEPSTGIADAVLFDRRIWVLRPLLAVTRAGIRDFLSARGVGWLDDPSNDDVKYERVRTRRQIAGEGGTSASLPQDNEIARLLLSERAADWIVRHFRLHGGGLGHIGPDGLDVDAEMLIYALGRLTGVFGGQAFVPGRVQIEALLAFIRLAAPGRMTAGRVVFDFRRDGLYFSRESRGILPLVLLPGERGLWDGRFEVRNGSKVAVVIAAADRSAPSFQCLSKESSASTSVDARDPALRSGRSFTAQTCGGWIPVTSTGMRVEVVGAELPKSAWKRAIAASQHILDVHDQPLSAEFLAQIELSPYFAPFDRFLTRFDLTFANSLSSVFARAPYAEPPLRSIDGKTI